MLNCDCDNSIEMHQFNAIVIHYSIVTINSNEMSNLIGGDLSLNRVTSFIRDNFIFTQIVLKKLWNYAKCDHFVNLVEFENGAVKYLKILGILLENT